MSDQHLATFWEHAEELRKTLLHVAFTLVLGALFSFAFYEPLSKLLCYPFEEITTQEVKFKCIHHSYESQLYTLSSDELTPLSSNIEEVEPRTYRIPPGETLLVPYKVSSSLKFFGPLDGMLSTLKMCFWSSIVLTSPYWLYRILLFIAPAFTNRRILPPFWALTLAFFFLGISFAYFISIPWANSILQSFNQNLGENFWGFSHYIDYTITLMLATGVAFESMALLLFLVHLGVVSKEQLQRRRRFAIVAIFTLSAILTPPDIFTQVLLAIPLMGLYELTILYANFTSSYRCR